VPRKVRDSNLETRAARSRLAVAHRPYYRLLEPGLHLGYRKLPSGPGTWLVRRYIGDGQYSVINLRTPEGEFVLADDYADADGHRIMTFAQAQRASRGPRTSRSVDTVADVIAAYFAYLDRDGRSPASIQGARFRAEAHILPRLGHLKTARLTPDLIRHWLDSVAKMPPRLRTRSGEPQRFARVDHDDGPRARRASANRIWTILRAALNHAFADGKIESDAAWRRVKPFKSVEVARARYLTVAEAKRLIAAADTRFRPLVQGALQTGCRYGELTRLIVEDYNRDAGTIAIRQSKTGKSRHVVLTDEGRAFFNKMCGGRAGGERLFQGTWNRSNQARPMREACKRAKLVPPISFHGLRHTWASLAVMGGVPLMVVARNLGHVDSRMVEKHYGHLAPSYMSDAIRKGAPRFMEANQ